MDKYPHAVIPSCRDFSADFSGEGGRMTEFLIAVFKGTYPIFSAFALLVIIYRIRQRRWTVCETVLLAIFILSFLLQIFQSLAGIRELFISRRYLLPFAPLMFGWSAWGLVELYRKLPMKWHKYVWGAAACFMIFLIWDGARPTIKSYTDKKKRIERQAVVIAADAIRKDYKGAKYGSMQSQGHFYFPALRPRVITDYPACGYWCGGSYQQPGKMDEKDADYALLEENVTSPQGMKMLYRFTVEDRNFVIYKHIR
jgi:hypothetical protein